MDLSSRILGPNSVTQAALPRILSETPDSYFEDILHQLQVTKTPSSNESLFGQFQTNAEYVYQSLSEAPGLSPTMPQGKSISLSFTAHSFILGAMYMLVRINISAFRDIADDKDFFTKLICEESLSCLPASVRNFSEYSLDELFDFQVFGIDNFIRIVLTTPMDKTEEACQRILEFCQRHAK